MTNEERSSRIREKQKSVEQRPSKTPLQSSSKKLEMDRKLARPSVEPDSKIRETKSGKKSVEKDHKRQLNGKKGAPLNFKELLAVAERNKHGGGAVLQPGLDRGSSLKNNGNNEESGNVKKKTSEDKFTKQNKSAKHKETTVADSKRSAKPEPNGKSLPSVKDSSIKKDLKRSSGFVNGSSERKLPSKTASSNGATTSDRKTSRSKSSYSIMERTVKEPHLGQKRDRATLKRKRNPYLPDDLDDFIDDGSGDDDDDDAPDVSKYIREIFGYDRRRFVHF